MKTGGAVVCWGSGGSDQTDSPPGSFSQVSAGTDHSCGVRNNGSVECWGCYAQDFGQCNPPEVEFVSVSAGYMHSCGLTTAGAIRCWGQNSDDQCSVPE